MRLPLGTCRRRTRHEKLLAILVRCVLAGHLRLAGRVAETTRAIVAVDAALLAAGGALGAAVGDRRGDGRGRGARGGAGERAGARSARGRTSRGSRARRRGGG